MYNEKRILALHYNTSKKIMQLTKTIGNFQFHEVETAFITKFINSKDNEDYQQLQKEYKNNIEKLQCEYEQIPNVLHETINEEYNPKILSITDSANTFYTQVKDDLDKFQQKINEQLTFLKTQIQTISESLLSEILTNSTNYIAEIDQQLNLQLKKMDELYNNHFLQVDNEFKEKEDELLKNSKKELQKIESNHQNLIKEVRKEYKVQINIDFPNYKNQVKLFQGQISSFREQVISFQKTISDFFQASKKKSHQLKNELKDLAQHNQKELNDLLHLFHLKNTEIIDDLTANSTHLFELNENQNNNMNFIKRKQAKQELHYQILELIPIFKNEFLNLQKSFVEDLKTCYVFFQFLQELNQIKLDHQKKLKDEKLLSDSILTIDDSSVHKLQETLSIEERKKREEINEIIQARASQNEEEINNQQQELDDQIEEELEEFEASYSEEIQVKETDDPSIMELKSQYEILEKELDSYSELSETNDPKLKSLDRQIASLRNAQKAANALHEQKVNNLISEYQEQINTENANFDQKLKEIQEVGSKAEEQRIKQKLSSVKGEIEELNRMKEDLFKQRIHDIEMLDNARKYKSAAFLSSSEGLQKQIDAIKSQKAEIEKNIQNLQTQFAQEKKKLKNDFTRISSKNQLHLKEIKNSGNSNVSEKKLEHLDKLDKIQVFFMETRDQIAKQTVTLKEENQMIKSRNQVLLDDTQKQYDKEIQKLRTQLDGYKGLYEEREAVARKRNFNAKAKSKNVKILTALAQELENQFHASLSELAQAKQKLKEFDQEHEMNSSTDNLLHSSSKILLTTPKRKSETWIPKPLVS